MKATVAPINKDTENVPEEFTYTEPKSKQPFYYSQFTIVTHSL